MNYLKKPVDDAWFEQTRINLSHMDDARTPGASTAPGFARVVPEPQCDWCAETRPVVVYAASRTASGEVRPVWRWATCERCDRMVTNQNWDAIHRRMVARFKRFFKTRLAIESQGRPVPDSLVNEAVYSALDDFHKYAVKLDDPASKAVIEALAGTGKTGGTD